MGTSGDEDRSTSRRSMLAALRARGTALHARSTALTSHRHAATSAGVIALTIAVAASAALASTGDTKAKDTAGKAHTKPSYLEPVGTLITHGQLPRPALGGDSGDAGVPSGTTPRPTTPVPNAPTNNQGIAVYQGSAGTLTPAGIATLALEHGCAVNVAPVATAIAMAESGGSPGAQGDVTLMTPVWDWSAGLWQIRGLRSERNTGSLRDSIANQNAAKNAAAMYVISSGCTNWTPWSTYNNGAYLRFMGIAEQAVRYVYSYYEKHGHKFPTVAPPDPTAVIPVGGSGGYGGDVGGPAPAAQAQGSSSAARAKGKPNPHSSAAAGGHQASGTRAGGQPAKSTGGGGGGGNPVAPAPATTKKNILPTLPVKLPTEEQAADEAADLAGAAADDHAAEAARPAVDRQAGAPATGCVMRRPSWTGSSAYPRRMRVSRRLAPGSVRSSG